MAMVVWCWCIWWCWVYLLHKVVMVWAHLGLTYTTGSRIRLRGCLALMMFLKRELLNTMLSWPTEIAYSGAGDSPAPITTRLSPSPPAMTLTRLLPLDCMRILHPPLVNFLTFTCFLLLVTFFWRKNFLGQFFLYRNFVSNLSMEEYVCWERADVISFGGKKNKLGSSRENFMLIEWILMPKCFCLLNKKSLII